MLYSSRLKAVLGTALEGISGRAAQHKAGQQGERLLYNQVNDAKNQGLVPPEKRLRLLAHLYADRFREHFGDEIREVTGGNEDADVADWLVKVPEEDAPQTDEFSPPIGGRWDPQTFAQAVGAEVTRQLLGHEDVRRVLGALERIAAGEQPPGERGDGSGTRPARISRTRPGRSDEEPPFAFAA